MTEEREHPELPRIGFEQDDLDGYSLEELSEYLDRGRMPRDPAIEASPGCRLALEALERLTGVTAELRAADTAAEAPADEGWVQEILAGIALDVRAGRRIPVGASIPGVDLGITEGAVRGVIRAAERLFPRVLIGSCRLDGEVTEPGAPVRIRLDVSVPYGAPILDLVAGLRAEIGARLRAHTELTVSGIDITVRDITVRESGAGESGVGESGVSETHWLPIGTQAER